MSIYQQKPVLSSNQYHSRILLSEYNNRSLCSADARAEKLSFESPKRSFESCSICTNLPEKRSDGPKIYICGMKNNYSWSSVMVESERNGN
jgi:hypothetical protein